MKALCRRGKFRDTEKVIWYHPFGIGIGSDFVFGISVLKVPPIVPKYRNTEFHSVFPALPDGHACFKAVFNPLVNFLKEVPVYA